MIATVRQQPGQADLFGGPALSGLRQADDFISIDEERELAKAIDGADLAPFKFGQFEGKRLTASFGWRYDYDTARFEEAASIPDWLLPVRDRAAQYAGHEPGKLVQALVTRYDAGAGIGCARQQSPPLGI